VLLLTPPSPPEWASYYIKDTLASRPDLVQELRPLLTEYVNTVVALYRSSPAASQEELGLCHGDLNLSNLLVDHERRKIVAVLDWEKSRCTLFDDELRGGEHTHEPVDRSYSRVTD
jgi:Ser/Thr protein kinase RdoA (MazF antagonist)